MSEERAAADAMYSPPPPAAQAPAAPERPADVMYGPPPKERPAPQVVATANIAKTPAERIYDAPPAEPTVSTAESAVEGQTPEAAPGDQSADADQAPVQLLALTETMQLRAPDGFGEWDQGALDTFAPVVERYGIEREDAQALLNMHVEALKREGAEAQQAYHQMLADAHDARVDEWRRQCRSDPEIVAYGVQNARAHGREVAQKVFTEEARKVLSDFGLTNHPAIVKSMLNARKLIFAQEQRNREGLAANYQRARRNQK